MNHSKFEDLIWQESIFAPPECEKIFQSLPDALAEVVSNFPDSAAVVSEEEVYSFHDLACRAAGLSSELNELGNLSGPVALLQRLGLDAIASWFACSLSGRPFLLLEPDNPPERITELIKISGCTLALVDNSTSHLLENFPEVTKLISDGRSGTLEKGKGLLPDEPAMIFPTSGSTGKPKLITYATTTIQVKVQSSIKLMHIPHESRVLIAGSHSNYGFLHHALVFLFSGGAVCLSDVKSSGFNVIFDSISRLGIRHVRLTPSLFRKLAVLPKAKKSLRLLEAVRFSGEPLLKSDLELANSVLKPNCLIQNVYGSTESSLFIWSNTDVNALDESNSVPIGMIYPYFNYAIRPLDDADDKDKCIGELILRSNFHALGDYQKGTINKDRFTPIEVSSDERVYATGDIVHQLPSGNLVHLGRVDRMVKIRGNRVFLSEIEQHLRCVKTVTGATVIAKIDQNDIALYGFITTSTGMLTSEDLRNQLSSKLPSYMIPRTIQTLAQIPLMVGGKVDYQALHSLISKPSSTNFNSFTESDSNRLVQIWDSILWIGAHKYDSDFFALGGDSLGFMTLLAEVEESFEKKISPQEIRTNCTFQNLSKILENKNPFTHQIVRFKSLRAKLFQPSLKPSKGIALSMPGIRGLSNAQPFHSAAIFEDYDLWVIDYPIKRGNMLQGGRWWVAALEIVEGIQKGIIPRPNVIFGFSFGGGLAWLVGRLLAGSQMRAEFVVMVDAPPLHRRKLFQPRPLKRELAKVSFVGLPKVIHVRRSPLGKFHVLAANKLKWKKNDDIHKCVDLPTVDHADMIDMEVLSLGRCAVRDFLNNKDVDFNWTSISSPPDILGCHIFYALNGCPISLQKVTDELRKETTSLKQSHLVSLIILMNSINDKMKSQEYFKLALEKYPESGTVYFLDRRLKRNTEWLFSGEIPDIYPTSIVALENNLALLNGNSNRTKPRPIKLFYLAIDVGSAFLKSRVSRLKRFLIKQLNRQIREMSKIV